MNKHDGGLCFSHIKFTKPQGPCRVKQKHMKGQGSPFIDQVSSSRPSLREELDLPET